MMKDTEDLRGFIRYTVTVEDAVAMAEFHTVRSDTAWRRRKWVRVIMSAAMAVICFLLGYNMHLTSPAIIGLWFAPAIGLLAGLVAYGLGSPGLNVPYLLRYLVRKRYSKPDASKFLGEHSLAVDEQGFTHKTMYTETHYAWGALERIETEPDHTYWYISSFQAIVIPHQRIIEGNFPVLLLAAKQHYKPGQAMERSEKP